MKYLFKILKKWELTRLTESQIVIYLNNSRSHSRAALPPTTGICIVALPWAPGARRPARGGDAVMRLR